MTFEPGKPNIDLVTLVEIEIGHRIDLDSWTQNPGGVSYYIVHSRLSQEWGELEGRPEKVEEDGELLNEKDNLVECENSASSWYWDSSNKRLYIHTKNGDSPSNHIVLSYIKRRFSTRPYEFGGKAYFPFLKEDSISDVSYQTGFYHEGGTQQSFSSIKLINFNSFFDKDLAYYIYEAKSIVGRIGRVGDSELNFIIFMNQWTGDIIWSDEEVEINIEDLRECVI